MFCDDISMIWKKKFLRLRRKQAQWEYYEDLDGDGESGFRLCSNELSSFCLYRESGGVRAFFFFFFFFWTMVY